MSEKTDKTWERPWTKQEFIDNADNWSLAGDVALLNTLKSFSDTLLTKANEVNNSLNNLTKSLDNTALRLSIAQNEFQSLRNNQFIESRVYEEDETVPEAEEEKPANENGNVDEDVKLNQMKDAVYKGLKVLDKYFDKVEVNVSDTEDEADDYTSYVLKPKDMYIDRPLPYVIGTEEWHKKWHVGLVDSSSESEIDDIVDKFSDTDSESDLPVPDQSQIKGTSDTSSELDFSHKTSSGRPVANSTFSDARQDTLGSSDSDQSSLPVQAPISSENFAEQLAAKLGNVINQKTDVAEPEVNTRPIQKTSETNRFPGLFFDEPPPLDEEDDMFNKTAQKGLFSGGDNLFDDEDEKETLSESNREATAKLDETTKKSTDYLFDNEDDDLFSNSAAKTKSVDSASLKTSKVQPKSLFDDDESSDDDIFSTSKIKENKPSYLQPASKTTYPLYDDEPPALEVDEKESPVAVSPKKKPPGGIFLPGANDIFANQKLGSKLQTRPKDPQQNVDKDSPSEPKPQKQGPLKIVDDPQSKTNLTNEQNNGSKQHDVLANTEESNPQKRIEKKVSLFDEPDVSPEKSSTEVSKSKKFSLFDEVDDLFKDDLFSAASTKKFTSSLFDDDLVEDDLFSPKSESQTAAKKSLFSEEDDSKELNKTETKSIKNNIKPEVSKKPLFSKDVKETLEKANEESIGDMLSENKNRANSNEDKTMEKAVKSKESSPASANEDTDPPNVSKKVKSLFEDDYDDDDIFDNSKLASNIKPKFSLFDDVPIIDDDGDLFMSKNLKKSTNTKTNAQNELFGDNTSKTKPKELSSEGNKKEEQPVQATTNQDSEKKIDSQKGKETTTEQVSNVQMNRPTHLNLVSDLESHVSDPSQIRLEEEENKTPSSRPHTVNIFSSSPPPEDDNWDSKSDDNDPFFDGYETNERSGLFDGPLSLPSYDSSGIGHENTRVDTDVSSSFDPYASSSRRLSSDIYNEQQSADSFFVTKNRTEPFSLDAIDENDQFNQNASHNSENVGDSSVDKTNSVFEVTPSGDSAELFNDPESTIGGQSSKLKPCELSAKKKDRDLSTEKDSPKSVNDKEVKDDAKESRKPRLSIVDQLLNESVNDGGNPQEVLEKEEVKGKNVTSLLDKLENPKSPQESDNIKTPGFPGKLKHNLTINVSALMPGSLPPKRKELPKSRSLESSSVDEADFIPTISTSSYESGDVPHPKPSLERSSSFENKSSEVEVLQSITKDRARVPLGRKPSTRRGRRDIQKVVSIDTEPTEKDTSEPVQTKRKENIPDNEIKAGDPLVISSDQNVRKPESVVETQKVVKENSKEREPKDDPKMVKTLPVTVPEISEAINVKTRTKAVSLFGEDSGDFTPVKVTKGSSTKESTSLFGLTDSDDADDLFSSIRATRKPHTQSVAIPQENTQINSEHSEVKTRKLNEVKTPVTSPKQEVAVVPKVTKQKSPEKSSSKKTDIFDSDEDSDDIFSSKGSKGLQTKPVKKEVVKKPLFSDDEDDDDDLFGSSNSTKTKPKTVSDQKRVVPQKPRTTTVKKLQNIKTDDDPLSSLLK